MYALGFIGESPKRLWSWECISRMLFGELSHDFFIKAYGLLLSPFFLLISSIPILLLLTLLRKKT